MARVLVIGGGANGLAAAAVLAKAGREVVLAERHERAGGRIAPREAAPAFHTGGVVAAPCGVDASLQKLLRLDRHGLSFQRGTLRTLGIGPDFAHAPLLYAPVRRGFGAGMLDDVDQTALAQFDGLVGALARQAGPALDTGAVTAALAAVTKLGAAASGALAQIAMGSLRAVLDARFQNASFKAVHAAEAALRYGLSLQDSGGGAAWLALALAARREIAPRAVEGGMPAFTAALEAATRAAGAEILTGVAVTRLEIAGGVLRGARLSDGSRIDAPVAVAALARRAVEGRLIDARKLDPAARMASRVAGPAHGLAQLSFALNAAPAFRGLGADDLRDRLILSGDMDDLEDAEEAARAGRIALAPPLAISVPSLRAPQLAPIGQHVLSVTAGFVPRELNGPIDGLATDLAARVIDRLSQLDPALPEKLIGGETLSPAQLRARFGADADLWSGDPRRLAAFVRPRTPGRDPEGLVFAGAETGLLADASGRAGRIAAERVLKDMTP